MDFEDVVQKFLKNSCYLDNGAGKLSNKWGVEKEVIKAAKAEARKRTYNLSTYGTEYNPKDVAFNKSKENNIIEYSTNPRILLLDIETAPLLAYVFQKQVWKARIGYDKIISDWFMLTWAAKWLGEDYTYSDRLTGKEAWEEDDYRITKSLWNLLDDAHIVIAHNGDSFDIPNINTRSIKYGLNPPSPFRQIDTLKIAQKQFGFTHNNLDALAMFFGLEGKISTNFELWKNSIRGDETALKEMEAYNKQDVACLEEVFLKLRPYTKGLPNLDLYFDTENPVCPSCGEHTLSLLEGKYFYTQAAKYKTFRCNNCGAVSRSKKGENFLNKKIISAIPR